MLIRVRWKDISNQIIRRNKEHIPDHVETSKTRSELYSTPLQDKIFEFIKKNPNCSRREIYRGVGGDEGHIRRAITVMQRFHKITETFNIGGTVN